MNLENLVPPLSLCKQIPAGHFADSALVWMETRTGSCGVQARITSEEVPAPTLAEIMPECGNPLYMWNDGKGWEVFCDANSRVLCKNDPNLATAALKLWLELEDGK